MGDESGGGGGPSGSSTRGQVGLTKKEQNVRATAQEPVRGGRRAGGNQTRSRESGFASDASRSQEGDRFVTSTEGAYRDLSNRATKGQISEGVMNVLPGTSILNEMGKKTATSIQDRLRSGGIAVYDSIGRIQGVVETKDTPFGRGEVYTGGSSYNPIGTGKKAQRGIGYVMDARDVQASERLAGGGDGGGSIGTTQTASTATNVTGSTTTLSGAARRTALQGAAGGASRRQFI